MPTPIFDRTPYTGHRPDGTVYTTTLALAQSFGVSPHTMVDRIEAIATLISKPLWSAMFEQALHRVDFGQLDRYYLVSPAGLTLLASGFPYPNAVPTLALYIKAFSAEEKRANRNPATPSRKVAAIRVVPSTPVEEVVR